MTKFTDEENRIMANLDQVYGVMRDLRVERESMPKYMLWKSVSGADYLYKSSPHGEKSLGRRSAETEDVYAKFSAEKEVLRDRIQATGIRLKSLMAQYRAMKLPMTMALPAEILQEMDTRKLLGAHFLVVGSFGFSAYEMESGHRFMEGLDETEDFDISWSSSGKLSVSADSSDQARTGMTSLLEAIQSVDASFLVSKFTPQKLINKNAFEIDVLCSQGDHFRAEVADKRKLFGGDLIPVELGGQDILHMGSPIYHVAVGRGAVPCPLLVPDPRFMAIHKSWLSIQPDRLPKKRGKDAKQAELLWRECLNMPGHPLDEDFFNSIPDKWKPIAIALDQKEVNAFSFEVDNFNNKC